MSNIADVLERESQTVDLEQGDFERLLGRRERKERNRRIRAGAVGVIVALAVGILLVRSLTSHHIPADRHNKPRPSPAAFGTLAFVGPDGIYVADPDGSNLVRIAHPRSTQECPHQKYWAETDAMWSPDGRYLAFRSSDCSGGMAPPKGEGVVITDATGNVFAKFPTGRGWQIRWSPDSTRVAVWDDFGKTIGIYATNGVRQTQLTMPPGGADGDTDPYWMPDGSGVVVFASTGVTELPLDGGAPRPAPQSFLDYLALPDPPSRVSSPDGSRVAYVDHRTLTVARSDGSKAREVSGNWVGGPVWSPTGDRVAITAKSLQGSSAPIELRVIDAATGSMTLVTEGEIGSEFELVGFTPQGDRMLFTTTDDAGWSLWSIGIDGSDARLVVDGTSGNFYRAP
jgi:Tol biopolymer transport system component